LSQPSDHEYPLVEGVPEFIHLARDFVFGDESVPVSEGRVSSVQTLSGSGALRVAAEWYVLSRVSLVSLAFLSFLSHFSHVHSLAALLLCSV
jgi:aspartate/tyrosine/aromatic aminotransferase